ncbi:MAG TPA: hypothetical protein VJ967_08415 [Clostridia bacterium]|nr:hypothetical protein [Clostridia bacterium]
MRKISLFLTLTCLSLVIIYTTCQNTSGVVEDSEGELEENVLYLEMDTSSDWTELIFTEEANLLKGIVTNYSETARTGIGETRLSLHQEIENAEAGDTVSMEAIVRLEVPSGSGFDFKIARGHIGKTTVRFYQSDSLIASCIGEYEWEGMNEDVEENTRSFSVRPSDYPEPTTADQLNYPYDELNAILENWAEGITEFSFPTHTLYWPDALHIYAEPDEEIYEVTNAVERLREEYETGPVEGFDYEALGFTPPLHIPQEDSTQAKLIGCGMYYGEITSTDTLWFEERQGEWKIIRHMWKIGYELR